MVQSLVAEHGLQEQVAGLLDGPDEFVCGLVIGHRVCQQQQVVRDIVLHLAPTPNEETDEDDGTTQTSNPTCIAELDVPWMGEHLRQISGMLPGGIDVIGAFFVTSEDIFASNVGVTHLRKILRMIATEENLENMELPVIHLDPTKKKVSSKIIDATPTAAQSIKNVELKYEHDPGHFQLVQGQFLLDIPVVFQHSEGLLKDKVEVALQELELCIKKSVLLFDDSYRQSDEYLDYAQAESVSNKKKKGKASKMRKEEADEDEGAEMKSTKVDILLDNDIFESLNDCETMDISSRLKISGRLHICAFLHSQASVLEAEKAIKTDIIRSMRCRIKMHCDSLVGNETSGDEEEQVPVMHEPPRRILIKLPHSRVCISDYLYPGETPYDSNESVEELLGFNPKIEDMNDELEHVAAPKETMLNDSDTESRTSSPTTAAVTEETVALAEKSGLKNGKNFSILVGLILFAIIAVIYLAFMSKSASGDGKKSKIEL